MALSSTLSTALRKHIVAIVVFILLIVAAAILLLLWRSCSPSERTRLAAYKAGLAKLASRGNVPLTFYGLVEDESGNPISGAKVTLDRKYYTMANIHGMAVRGFSVSTDDAGRFTATGKSGTDLSIREIDKDGYEWVVEIKPSFNFISPSTDQEYLTIKYYSPDPDNPVRFVMRKKNPATLVFKKEFDPNIVYAGVLYNYDVVYGTRWAANNDRFFESQRRYRTFLRKDLLFKAEKSADGKNCVLTFSAPGEGNGVLQSSKILYTAPEDGYQKELQVVLPLSTGEEDEGERSFHLYLKLRSGMEDGVEKSIYAGMIAPYNHYITDEWISFRFYVHVNPSGGRSLDYSEEEFDKFWDLGDYTVRGQFMNDIGFDEKPNYP